MNADRIRRAYAENQVQPLTEAYFLEGTEWAAMIGHHLLAIRRENNTLVPYLDGQQIDLPGDLIMDLTELGTEHEL